jgi:hypothetical protein
MRNLGNSLKVRHVIARVANSLHVNGLGAVVNRSRDISRIVALDELGLDAQAREEHLELVVGAAVEVAGCDDVVAGMRQRCEGEELRGLARRGGDSGDAAFESCDAFLEDIDGGLALLVWFLLLTRSWYEGGTYVRNPRVDVAEFLETEESRAVGRVIEDEGLEISLVRFSLALEI